jgi:Ca2+-binding EF-hand superfamily protein
MEFFTVFSASRYPNKEGFNQGAILKLKPNGEHNILRYATEDDEPLIEPTFTSFHEESPSFSEFCSVDSVSIRRALREAILAHRLDVHESMKALAATKSTGGHLPLDEVIDTLVNQLNISHGSLFKKAGARLALAKAMFHQCDDVLSLQSIDVQDCIKAIAAMEDDDDDNDMFPDLMLPHYPWLRAVFDMVDSNHDGVLSQKEWNNAVNMINAKLPDDTEPIDAEETWHLLDMDGDGSVTASEWELLGKALCR